MFSCRWHVAFYIKLWYYPNEPAAAGDKKTERGNIMAYKIRNFISDEPNCNIDVKQSKGCFSVAEYDHDMSVSPGRAVEAYYASRMEIRKRQLVCDLSKARGGITVQSGAMQWMLGDVQMTSGIKGAGDMLGKMIKGKVTGESAVKPVYKGNGTLVLEPTYKHLIVMDVKDWPGGAVLEDGMFLACEDVLRQTIAMRGNFSSAVAGGEGLFNICLKGAAGLFAVESECPYDELVDIELQDDVLKIDGSYAVAWSAGLDFTVERSGKSLIGSAASGEGLVNVYRGTGRVLMMPLAKMPDL